VKCWGSIFRARKSPTDVAGLTGGIAAVSAGQDACALSNAVESGVGANYEGQLGDGMTRARADPVRVEVVG
jgi:hypothetical protein